MRRAARGSSAAVGVGLRESLLFVDPVRSVVRRRTPFARRAWDMSVGVGFCWFDPSSVRRTMFAVVGERCEVTAPGVGVRLRRGAVLCAPDVAVVRPALEGREEA